MNANRFRIMLWVAMVMLVLAASWSTTYVTSREIVESQRRDCERGIVERLDVLKENSLNIVGNKAVAEDPKQPPRTKTARRKEYEGEEKIMAHRRERVNPAHGGKLDCKKVAHEPSFVPLP